MPLRFQTIPGTELGLTQPIQADTGEEIRVVRLSATHALIVGPQGSLPPNTTVIWTATELELTDIPIVGAAWGQIRDSLRKVGGLLGIGDDGDGSSADTRARTETTGDCNTTVIVGGSNVTIEDIHINNCDPPA